MLLCDMELVDENSPPFKYKCQRCELEISLPHEETNFKIKCKGELRGMGDVIATVTDTLRIKKCGGCKNRMRRINKFAPFPKTGNVIEGVENVESSSGQST